MDVRLATFDDADLLFRWHNDPLTVENSRTKSGSEWDGHCRWLKSNLAREDTVFLVGLDDSEPCGLVWFRRNRAGVWETSLNMAAEFRGRRLSEPMLRASLNWMRQNRTASTFSTEIKDGNEGAIKAYERCGYRYVHPSPGFGTYFAMF